MEGKKELLSPQESPVTDSFHSSKKTKLIPGIETKTISFLSHTLNTQTETHSL